MYVHFLKAAGVEYADPTWPEVERAIRALDGKVGRDPYTDVAILGVEGVETPCMSVSGHWQGRYTVSAEYGGSDAFMLIDPAAPAGVRVEVTFPCSIRVGRSMQELVELPVVLKAAKTFVETGKMDPDLSWERA